MRWLIFMIMMIGCLSACSSKQKQGILGKEKMQAVMWDIIEADVFTEQYIKKDSSKNPMLENMKLQNKIFAFHKVSRDDYYKSYDYYIYHTDLMKIILDSMSSKGERDRTKMFESNVGGKGESKK